MTHDDLRDLLDASAGTPPRDLDPDALLATAGRRRTARLGAGLVAGAAVVLAGVLVLALVVTGIFVRRRLQKSDPEQ